MRKLILALPLIAGACASPAVNDAELCGAALLAANTSSPAKLAQIAFATPACLSLAGDALQVLINKLAAQQAARGVRP